MLNKIVLLSLIILLNISCNFFKSRTIQSTPTSGTTAVAIDESLRPAMEAQIDLFQAIYPTASIKAVYCSEQNAFELLLADSLQLIAVTRKLRPDELEIITTRRLVAKQLAVAKDGIAVIVHPDRKISQITVNQISKLLNGELSNWKQLENDAASSPIRVLFDDSKSGIVRFMADSLTSGKLKAPLALAKASNRDVIEYTAAHSDVIGFISSAWVVNKNDSLHLSFHKKIRVLAVSTALTATQENSFKPYQAYLLDNQYPLQRTIYLINTEPWNGLATGLVSFIAADKGQLIFLKSGILPIVAPARVVNVRPQL